jgi:hypothetical protein
MKSIYFKIQMAFTAVAIERNRKNNEDHGTDLNEGKDEMRV